MYKLHIHRQIQFINTWKSSLISDNLDSSTRFNNSLLLYLQTLIIQVYRGYNWLQYFQSCSVVFRDFGRVSGLLDSRVLRAKIPAKTGMRLRVRAPEWQNVRQNPGGNPAESGK
jgi:hypothetical protein